MQQAGASSPPPPRKSPTLSPGRCPWRARRRRRGWPSAPCPDAPSCTACRATSGRGGGCAASWRCGAHGTSLRNDTGWGSGGAARPRRSRPHATPNGGAAAAQPRLSASCEPAGQRRGSPAGFPRPLLAALAASPRPSRPPAACCGPAALTHPAPAAAERKRKRPPRAAPPTPTRKAPAGCPRCA